MIPGQNGRNRVLDKEEQQKYEILLEHNMYGNMDANFISLIRTVVFSEKLGFNQSKTDLHFLQAQWPWEFGYYHFNAHG